MNVRLAAQLMSEKTANCIRLLGEQGLLQTKEWEGSSEFIMLVDP